MYRLIFSVLWGALAMTATFAQNIITPAIGTAEHEQLLNAARNPLERKLGQPVKFVVKGLKRSGDFAFLYAAMQGADGQPLNYTGTAFEGVANAGLMSKDYAALLQRSAATWNVRAEAIGPTDVTWASWVREYGAPAAIFTFD
jgi:hypothetical protein